MLVTGIGPSQFANPELPSHYQMVRAIKAKLDEWTPSVFIGHNSLSFDEHLLRQAFYKTLHAPYLTNTNNNCRSDSLRMFQSLHLYAPLPSVVHEKLDVAIARRLMGEDGPVPWLTLPRALTDTGDMLAVASGEETTLLAELQSYLVDRSDEASEKIS